MEQLLEGMAREVKVLESELQMAEARAGEMELQMWLHAETGLPPRTSFSFPCEAMRPTFCVHTMGTILEHGDAF